MTAIHVTLLDSQFTEEAEARSVEAITRTKDIPGKLIHENVTGDSMMLRWSWLEPESPPTKIIIEYRQVGKSDKKWIQKIEKIA